MMHRYRTGEWLGVVTEHGVAVLPGDLDTNLVERIWHSLRSGKGLGGVLDVLTGAFGTSLSALPSFAVVSFTGTEAGIAVRGPLEVGVVGDDDAGEYTVSGARVSTWSERVSSNPDMVQIVTALGTGTEIGLPESLPIADGVVPCSAISVVLSADRLSVVLPFPDRQQGPEPVSVQAQPPEPVPAEELVPVGATTSEPQPVAPTEPQSTQAEAGDGWHASPVHDPSHTISDPGDAEGTDYDWLLSGETIARSVEGAAIRGEEDGDGAGQEPTAPQRQLSATAGDLHPPSLPVPGVLSPPEYPALPPARPFHVPSTPGGVIDGLPDFPWDAVAEPGEPDNDDTISIEALAEMRRRSGTPVQAVPAARQPAAARNAGRLDVSTGESVVLDRNVIIGRRPKSTRAVADMVPYLLTVPSPTQDISRNHVEIRVEGDHVLAVDQETTNGTRLLRTGRDPERLHPREATMLSFGDVLDLGEGVTVTFREES
ncbi:FHA domain-containing protein [Arthrobacter sp. MDT3-24]